MTTRYGGVLLMVHGTQRWTSVEAARRNFASLPDPKVGRHAKLNTAPAEGIAFRTPVAGPPY